ncbi:glycerophosphodiester phosphodiesterase family protein [Pedobacter sp. MC2016-15]|uniref:glycerophosphodiester phosphodiesterase n=1 Tax=Pedobacter sp. MC2016-15 TaxID=2994473 RepID=UPI0022484F39|nr:glycerophosphodiester phosphodiesterase family protein [Pedobacter sp. MC2016-15]MCX2479489.1 glycerophosphodiester phosphodiesterase family protein [Pedobacter sp. MC2016-15]
MKQLFFLIGLLCVAYSSNAQKMKWNNNSVIAHRGAWKKKNIPENSIAALKEAVRLKCYGSEFDVHFTKDSVIVVNHDDVYKGLTIGTSTYAELQKQLHTNGEQIPTLESYLKEGMKQKGTKLILEIKMAKTPETTIALTDAAVKMVKALKADAWVEYISFSYPAVQRVLELDPSAKTAFLAYIKGDVPLEKLKEDHIAQADYFYTIYKEGDWFKKAKELGITINAWTVNKEEDMQWLIDEKADFITTNEPELLFDLLKKK